MKIKELTPRQRRVLTLLSQGLSPTAVAEATGYTVEHVSRLSRSESGQLALAELRSQIEAQLVAELPWMVAEALEILKAQLKHPLQPQRAAAAQFVLKSLARPFIQAVAKTPAGNGIAGDTFDAVVVEGASPNGIFNTGTEANNDENHADF